jgi:integrase
VVSIAARPLYEYIYHGGRDTESFYTFTSQRSDRWWKNIKAQANVEEWELIHDVTFHDLRHDFAHRAREAGAFMFASRNS